MSVAESITVAIAAGVVVGGRAGCRDGGREEAGKARREREEVKRKEKGAEIRCTWKIRRSFCSHRLNSVVICCVKMSISRS